MDKKNEKPQKAAAEEKELLHDFSKSQQSPLVTPRFVAVLFVVILLGIATGYFLSNKNLREVGVSSSSTRGETEPVTKGTIIGSDDTKTFSDSTEGILQEGGKNGEGQFHLVRPGGESQYVYLTSSTVDLSQFKEMKIKVWGQTQNSQKVGWLMDVGRVEVLQ